MSKRLKALAASAAGLGLALSLTACAPTYDGDTTGCVVEEKDTQAVATLAKRDPRVYTSCGVFHIADDPMAGQWNSADTYSAIEVGKVYDFEAVGYRNGFFSMFPNIVGAEEVPGD